MASFPVIYRGLHFPQRIPSGTEQSVRSVTRQNFLDFYQRGYRPDLMVLVAAGDFDPAAMTTRIEEILGPIEKPSTPIPERQEGRLDTAKTLRGGLYKITDIGSVAATVASVSPAPTG